MIVVVDDYTGKPTYLYGTGALISMIVVVDDYTGKTYLPVWYRCVRWLISMIVVVDDYTGKPTYLYGTGALGG